MGVDSIVLAVGEDDSGRLDTIVETVTAIAEPTNATVIITHVMTEETYREAIAEIDEAELDAERDIPDWLERWARSEASESPGFEGDVPQWAIERWSPPATIEDSAAMVTVLGKTHLINELANRFEEAGVDYKIRVDVGDPADRVVAIADELNADFVVVGGRNRSPARQALFGSVSQDILRSVRCPVISLLGAELE